MDKERFTELVRDIYKSADALEAMFPGRHFTPDGHMVGSLGEALAAFHYAVDLFGASMECHDGICEGRSVQVKATQRERVALSGEPEHLLVLQLKRDGSFVEVYNGPGALAWAMVKGKPRPKNGQYQISVSALRDLMKRVPVQKRLRRRDA